MATTITASTRCLAGTYKLQILGKEMPNADGTFQYEKLGTESVEAKEGESQQLDLK